MDELASGVRAPDSERDALRNVDGADGHGGTSTSWLDALRANDLVIVARDANDRVLRTIDRVTPTQVVIGPFRYRKRDGREMGEVGTWSFRRRLVEATPEAMAAIKEREHRNALMYHVRNQTWHSLTTSQLERVVAVLVETHSTTSASDSTNRGVHDNERTNAEAK